MVEVGSPAAAHLAVEAHALGAPLNTQARLPITKEDGCRVCTAAGQRFAAGACRPRVAAQRRADRRHSSTRCPCAGSRPRRRSSYDFVRRSTAERKLRVCACRHWLSSGWRRLSAHPQQLCGIARHDSTRRQPVRRVSELTTWRLSAARPYLAAQRARHKPRLACRRNRRKPSRPIRAAARLKRRASDR